MKDSRSYEHLKSDQSLAAIAAQAAPAELPPIRRPSLLGHIQIARIDHWVKNVFVLPGIVVALSVDRARLASWSWLSFLLGMLAVCLIASSNYVLNEILDAPYDLAHPDKRTRPVPAGRVSIAWGYVQWLTLMAAGVLLGLQISRPFTVTLLALWMMGCIYNIPRLGPKTCPMSMYFPRRSTIRFACWQAGI